jgi:hypothetical protein
VLAVLTPHIVRCKETLSAQTVGNALYGLQSCSSDAVEVRAVLAALTPHVVRCKEALSAQEVGNALNGLKSCSSDAVEVRSLLAALTSHVARFKMSLDSQAIGNALYGLRSCSSDAVEVRAVLLCSLLCQRILRNARSRLVRKESVTLFMVFSLAALMQLKCALCFLP